MSFSDLSDFQQPKDLTSALQVLDKYGDDTLIVAGGTFVHGLNARGFLDDVEAVLDISRLPLSEISLNKKSMSIGSTATYGALLRSKPVQSQSVYGALKDALSYPPPQIVNVATIGGCLAASCPLFDLPTAISVLGGKLKSQSSGGEKTYELDEFFTGLFESSLGTGELITSIEIPNNEHSTSGFAKLETNANDLAIINAAVSLNFKKGLLKRKLSCTSARVFVGGGVGDTVKRAPAVEAILADGNPMTDEKIALAVSAAKDDVIAQSDHRASAKYRQSMIEVYLKKAIARAMARMEA